MGSERGIALVAVMSASSLLLALGLSLALTTTIEVGIATSQRDAVQTLHAAEAGLERAIADLATADWDAALAGAVTSPFHDGAGVVALPDGSRLDVRQETNRLRCGAAACADADMDRVTAARPWGRNNPRWTVFASGSLAELLPDEADIAARSYLVIWVADDPAENDARPLRDGGPPALEDAANQANPGRGALWLHARAYGPSGARRSIEAVVERDPRWPPAQLRMRVWREIT
jgi:Tfp pilus assembly protein PilX